MAGTSPADGYGQAAASMGAAGIGGVGGTGASGNRGNSGGKGGGKGGGGGGGRAGGVGSPGVGGGFDGNSKGTSAAEGYGQAAESMGAAGVGGVGGTGASGNRGSDNSSSGGGGGGGRAGGVGTAGVGGGFDGNSSPDRPDNQNYGGPKGMGGVGGLYMDTAPLDTAREYQRAYETMSAAGVRSVGGLMTDYTPSARQAQTESMRSLATYGRDVISVVDAGKGWTTVELRDGTVERRDGTRASRNNNPGNIEYGNYAKSKGAVGTDGRFAVFSTPQQGLAAMKDLVFGPNYASKTIADAIGKYAPAFENNTKSYANEVAKGAGVSTDTKISDLSEAQKDKMIEAMSRVEGGKPYDSTTVSAGNWGIEAYANEATPSKMSTESKTAMSPDTPAPASKSNLSAAAQEYQYAGVTKAAAPTDVAKYAYTSRFRDMYISPHYTLEQQGLTQADLDRQTPEVDRAVVTPGQKAEVGAAQQNASVGQRSASQQAAANAPTSNNVPANTPTEQPANPAVADTPATQPDEATTEQKRGTGAQVVAGGIDVLAGMIPGIGIGASVFNAGAALTGKRTIGERLVDDFASGDNPGGPVTSREADSLLERETQTHGGSKVDSTASDEAAPAKDVNRFVRLYLQTPTEKWGRTKGLMTATA